MDNNNKFKVFLQAAKCLNLLGIVPALFGSLGLSRQLQKSLEVNDVDVVIPDGIDRERLILEMKKAGFESGKKERQFFKDGAEVNFDRESDVENLVDFNALKIVSVSGIKFKELSLEQYFHFYEEIMKNPERAWKREKDERKIRMIKNNLNY